MGATNIYLGQQDIKYPLVLSVATYISFIFKCMGVVYDDRFAASNEEE